MKLPKILDYVKNILGRTRKVRARYDSAQTSVENSRHWAQSDHLSAMSAMTPTVRRTLRSRARYEFDNNSYARGMVTTLANYIIGTGPRLQLQTDNETLNKLIEQKWRKWSNVVDLAQKLRIMRIGQSISGETFMWMVSNANLLSPVQLEPRLIEADQIETPWSFNAYPNLDIMKTHDGITFDDNENPKFYWMAKYHPGNTVGGFLFSIQDYTPLEASTVLHLFRPERPGQIRGIPDITPALPLFANLRRYTLAVVSAAEHAALPSGVIQTDAPADSDIAEVKPLDEVDLDRGTWLTMPYGWKIGQIRAEQPTSTYDMFKHEIINEIARCLDMPYNIAAGNSSDYNYASGRLDHQSFYKFLTVDRTSIECKVLDPLFQQWMWEAIRVEGFLPYIPKHLRDYLPHQWFWDGLEHVDPAKEANAQKLRLQSHTTTLAAEYAKQGQDWEVAIRQRAKELELMKKLGLPISSDKSSSVQVTEEL